MNLLILGLITSAAIVLALLSANVIYINACDYGLPTALTFVSISAYWALIWIVWKSLLSFIFLGGISYV